MTIYFNPCRALAPVDFLKKDLGKIDHENW